jgi:hypothetical protein
MKPASISLDQTLHEMVIKDMLSNRQIMIDVSEEDELERIRRLIPLLTHSKKYRLKKIELANKLWTSEASRSFPTARKVSFSKSAKVRIYDPSVSLSQISLQDLIDS